MAGLDRLSVKGLITKIRENKAVYKLIDRLQIKVSNIEDAVESLSGGNQQKVAVGNWLNTRPDILLLDEPTRGIDVQAKQQIFQIIWDLSKEGISSIVVSSELEELIEVCHRILVMKNGRIINEVMPEDVSTDELFLMCMSSEKT
jgi:ribose transport system ATP-binding protein